MNGPGRCIPREDAHTVGGRCILKACRTNCHISFLSSKILVVLRRSRASWNSRNRHSRAAKLSCANDGGPGGEYCRGGSDEVPLARSILVGPGSRILRSLDTGTNAAEQAAGRAGPSRHQGAPGGPVFVPNASSNPGSEDSGFTARAVVIILASGAGADGEKSDANSVSNSAFDSGAAAVRFRSKSAVPKGAKSPRRDPQQGKREYAYFPGKTALGTEHNKHYRTLGTGYFGLVETPLILQRFAARHRFREHVWNLHFQREKSSQLTAAMGSVGRHFEWRTNISREPGFADLALCISCQLRIIAATADARQDQEQPRGVYTHRRYTAPQNQPAVQL